MSDRGKRNGLKLPPSLQQELGIEVPTSRNYDGQRPTNFAGRRKEQRKAVREQKNALRTGKHGLAGHTVVEGRKSEKEDDKSLPKTRSSKPLSKSKTAKAPAPRSILKKTVALPSPSHIESDFSDLDSRNSSPGLILDESSQAYKDRAAHDDAEIKALEKKLGLKTKKLSKSFDDDGLADILDGISSDEENRKRKREGDEWLKTKRRKAASGQGISDEVDSEASLILDDETEDSSNDEFSSFASDEEPPRAASTRQKQKENPYVAPTSQVASTAKYIPPSRRKQQDPDTEAIIRVRRQLQGYLNKLSEANLVSILNDVEKLYQSNARQDVSSTLISLLLDLFCDRSSLQATFVILHASLIAAIYKVVGTDFAAEMVSRLVERLEGYLAGEVVKTGKECNNLLSLLSYLFTFHVISSTLVFDFLRQLLEDLSENNTELLLRIVRDCGPQLRQDDPSSLKRMVQIMQNVTAQMAAEGQDMSVRTKFMIEAVTDLKNNKLRGATSTSGVASEHITQMRKLLGTLNNRTLKASEPLRISRDDIKNSDKRGKWWLVGASWKGQHGLSTDEDRASHQDLNQDFEGTEAEESDLLALARQYRMNTSVRRSIFVSIMSANDFQDAHVRLLKLRLKRSQEQEIPKVLLRCAGAEMAYNPYYTLIARKLCSEKKVKMVFQFALWDFFKKMGEKDGDEDSDGDDADSVELSEVVNLAKMYGSLILDGALGIGVLRVLNLALLKEQAKMFVELLLVIIMTGNGGNVRPDEKAIANVFAKAADTPQLIKPLQYFLKKELRKTDLVARKEQELVRTGCRIAIDILSMIEVSTSTMA